MAFVAPIAAALSATAAASAPYLAVASLAAGGLSAFGQMRQGQAANKMAKFEAAQMERQAGERRAVAQREAINRRREADILESRALAAAGASGGGTLDPGVLSIIGGIHREGEFSAATELFNAESAATNLESQAGATRLSGRNSRNAGYLGAATTMLSSIGDTAMYFGRAKSETLSNQDTLDNTRRYSGADSFAYDLSSSSRSGVF